MMPHRLDMIGNPIYRARLLPDMIVVRTRFIAPTYLPDMIVVRTRFIAPTCLPDMIVVRTRFITPARLPDMKRVGARFIAPARLPHSWGKARGLRLQAHRGNNFYVSQQRNAQ